MHKCIPYAQNQQSSNYSNLSIVGMAGTHKCVPYEQTNKFQFTRRESHDQALGQSLFFLFSIFL